MEHTVSLHVRSRHFRSLDDAATFIKGLSIMYEVYADLRRSRVGESLEQQRSVPLAWLYSGQRGAEIVRAWKLARSVKASQVNAAAIEGARGNSTRSSQDWQVAQSMRRGKH